MKVFLSSTYVDLIEYREKAANAIERLGQQGVRMEVFGARPAEATSVCMREIETSDAFIGIYAHRYGFLPKGSDASITEQEFDFAQSKAKPSFCFLVDEDFAWLPRMIENDPGQSKLYAFKKKVSQMVIHDTFTTPEDLAYKVASSLGRFLIMQKIKEELDRVPGRDRVSTPQGRDQVARRASRLQGIISGARVLLVNDVPQKMSNVIAIISELGVNVQVATNSDDALSMLANEKFHAVISDMRRGKREDEGMRFLNRMRKQQLHKPTIFTAGQYEPSRGTPPYAFGITNRVDELLNLLFDILERVRG